jgi:hypothetical protein
MASTGTGNGAAGPWQDELIALLAELEAARTPDAEADVLTRLAGLDPELQAFLLERMAEQQSPEAAAFLALVAAHAATPSGMRDRAQEALAALARKGIAPPATGEESFYAGWVQVGRERGEQIMILGWRLADGRLEALVFLLDWRGDGLKDFYRTREIDDAEWRELVEHNGQKGAPLTAISLAEGRALLDEALAEGKRFSRPVPREYRLAQGLVRQRVLDAAPAPETPRPLVTPDLDAEAVVAAYTRALHYRDFALAWELLAPAHPARVSPSRADGVEALRRAHKHTPRRRSEVSTSAEGGQSGAEADRAIVVAEGQEEVVEPSGRRVRRPVRERHALRRTGDGWRIEGIERL